MPEKIKFGTDGWRAVIGQEFNLKNVAVVAQAIADYLLLNTQYSILNTQVAVGYDNRRLSPESARVISQVLAANRIKVLLSDRPLPTPAVSHAVRIHHCVAGVMVTASHNPARFNGIKIKDARGSSVEKTVTNQVEQLIFKHKPNKISLQKAQQKRLLKISNLVADYLKLLKSYLDIPRLKKGKLKVLVDAMYGTANSYIAEILKHSACRVTTIHKKRDCSFGGIKPEPIEDCLKEAAGLIKRKGFDLGLATDGDADRIAALDERGRFVNPQQVIALLLLYLVGSRKLKGAVVKTISGTGLLDKIAKKYKLKVYETPVGFKHIADLMQKKDILIGGEEGGGIGFKDYLPERDGMLGGLLLMEMMIAENKSLSQLLDQTHEEFGSYFYLRKDLKCLPTEKEKIRTRLIRMHRLKKFLGTAIARVKDYDGLKFCLADESWILFRLSGTEPVLRIYAEAGKLTRTRKLIAEGVRWVRS